MNLHRSRQRRQRNERGAVAILVALFLTSLLIGTAMVLDFGMVRVDRQVNKSAADAATIAGLQGMAGSNSKPYPYRGICTAIAYLEKNADRFSGVTSGGTWSNGNGASAPNGCTTSALQNQVCKPTDRTTWGRFTWNGSYQGEPLQVVIESGYEITASGWSEETLAAVAADRDDGAQGCNQLAVTVTQNRDPGLGSLATTADLVSAIRSVGRVDLGPGRDAPAMILLKQTGCPVLSTGSSGGGSFVRVYGETASNGVSVAGSVHADTDGSGCTGGSNQSIFLGKSNNGIVAYAAPMPSNTAQPDPSKPGQLTSVAGAGGITGSVIVDAATQAYAATGVDEGNPGTPLAPTGRDLVTRGPVDERYLGITTPPGIRGAVNIANGIFNTVTSKAAALASTPPYKIIDGCSATPAEIAAITATDRVYVNCTTNAGYEGTGPILGETIVFAGSVKPPSTAGTSVSLPNAKKVYIFGAAASDAISIGNNAALRMNQAGTNTTATGRCSTNVNQNAASKSLMVVKAGQFKQTGGLLQLCRTTVIMMGNRADACLPTANGTPPTTTPCGGGTGDGQVTLTGGASIDWSAPNTLDVTTDGDGNPTATARAAWADPHGPEDLALWSESAGLSNNPTYAMGGSGVMTTTGVFMIPNAGPFNISGGSSQSLVDAQYIATSIQLNGTNTNIKMRVDPYAAVTVPRVRIVGLVR